MIVELLIRDYSRAAYWVLVVFCAAVLLFLLLPSLVIAPLSLNEQPYFTYPIETYSAKWYEAFFTSENWLSALKNSLVVAFATTVIATTLGTLAAIGLARAQSVLRPFVIAVILSPMVVPIIVSAIGIYFLFAKLGLNASFPGLIVAHTIVATPFVFVTVSASMSGFDWNLMRAAANLGAGPVYAFRAVMAPILMPGILSGGMFAFITSFDDIVIALFVAGTEQRTLPKQMWSGVRENLDPTIIAVSTMLVALSFVLVLITQSLQSRAERLKGSPR